MMESEEPCALKITTNDFKQIQNAKNKTNQKGLNAKTLFSYSGDASNDCFA